MCTENDAKYFKILSICANTKSTWLTFCRVDVLLELHIVVVVFLAPESNGVSCTCAVLCPYSLTPTK